MRRIQSVRQKAQTGHFFWNKTHTLFFNLYFTETFASLHTRVTFCESFSIQHSGKRNHTRPDLPPSTRHLSNVCVMQPLQPRIPNTAVKRNCSENCFLIPLNRSHTFHIPMAALNKHTNTHARVDVSTDLHALYSTALRTSSSSSSSSSTLSSWVGREEFQISLPNIPSATTFCAKHTRLDALHFIPSN